MRTHTHTFTHTHKTKSQVVTGHCHPQPNPGLLASVFPGTDPANAILKSFNGFCAWFSLLAGPLCDETVNANE
jgi:hypothetical protein